MTNAGEHVAPSADEIPATVQQEQLMGQSTFNIGFPADEMYNMAQVGEHVAPSANEIPPFDAFHLDPELAQIAFGIQQDAGYATHGAHYINGVALDQFLDSFNNGHMEYPDQLILPPPPMDNARLPGNKQLLHHWKRLPAQALLLHLSPSLQSPQLALLRVPPSAVRLPKRKQRFGSPAADQSAVVTMKTFTTHRTSAALRRWRDHKPTMLALVRRQKWMWLRNPQSESPKKPNCRPLADDVNGRCGCLYLILTTFS